MKGHPGDEPGGVDAEGCLEDLLSNHARPFVAVREKTYRSARHRPIPVPRRGCPPRGAHTAASLRSARTPEGTRLRAMRYGDIRGDLHLFQLR